MLRVIKLKYDISFFDISQMKGGRIESIEILPEGTMIDRRYKVGSRKVVSKCEYTFNPDEFESLCDSIKKCIDKATEAPVFMDDSGAELTIYHECEYTETVPRSLGDGKVYIDRIMWNFIDKHMK